jgi:hypothetical protein
MANPIVLKRFEHGDRLYVQAQQIWLILVAFIESSKISGLKGEMPTLYYSELALRMGREEQGAGRFLGRQLGILGHLCIRNELPPINTIVVSKITGMPGDEVVLPENKDIVQAQRAVFKEDWFRIRVPTTGMLRSVWECNDI